MKKIKMNQIIIITVLLPYVMSSIRVDSLDEEYGPAEPYNFGYEVHDKEGEQWRSEKSDGHGKVEGTYGYVDNLGLKREVHYIADNDGFRADIKTNEPGMDVPNPASVNMNANPPSDYDHPITIPSSKFQGPNDYDTPVPVQKSKFSMPSTDYDATIYGIEALSPEIKPVVQQPFAKQPRRQHPLNLNDVKASQQNSPQQSVDPKGFYKYHKFAEQSIPPIYVVDGHLQSPWFPMDSPQGKRTLM